MKSLSLVLTLALSLTVFGCKKDEPKPGAGTATATGTAKPEPEPEPKPEPKAEPTDDGADYIRVVTPHLIPKESDPVVIHVTKFKIASVQFDPANLEGATATIEMDMTSLDSQSPKRDNHLKSPDYVNAGEFATGTIAVANVKKSGDKTYTADATVKVRGAEKVLPVTFEVLESSPTSVKVKAEHEFARLDFGIGAPVDQEQSAPEKLKIELRLTFTKA